MISKTMRCAPAPVLLASAAGGRNPAIAPPATDPMVDLATQFQRDVAVLASDDMEGRDLGTAGLGRAADWIEERLRALGLAPAFGRSYRQPFRVKAGVALAAPGADGWPANELEGVAADDWTPLGLSSSGAFSGELAFVGYGIEAPPVGYRELDGIDIAGKVEPSLAWRGLLVVGFAAGEIPKTVIGKLVLTVTGE